MTATEKTTPQVTLFENYCLASRPDTAGGSVQRLAQAYPSCILPFARVFLPAGARCPPRPLLPGHLEHESRRETSQNQSIAVKSNDNHYSHADTWIIILWPTKHTTLHQEGDILSLFFFFKEKDKYLNAQQNRRGGGQMSAAISHLSSSSQEQLGGLERIQTGISHWRPTAAEDLYSPSLGSALGLPLKATAQICPKPTQFRVRNFCVFVFNQQTGEQHVCCQRGPAINSPTQPIQAAIGNLCPSERKKNKPSKAQILRDFVSGSQGLYDAYEPPERMGK